MTIATDSPAVSGPAPAVALTTVGRRQRWALVAVLSVAAVAYLWDLSGSGWANEFYAAAAQAGSQSWKAFVFGSSDAANSITVDKPPLSLWPAMLAIRLFGLNSWSIIVPQALLGVASVALLWDTVRRWFGETAGLAAGLVLALTPVAVAIFRYNNPDALLVFLMIAAAWALLRAVDDGRLRWLVLCGVCVGLGYLTKQLEIALLLPALAVSYLFAGPPPLLKRAWQLMVALLAAVLAAGWWVALVQLWPAKGRPWIGGSQHNSILELSFGYNGLGRLNGDEPGSTGFALSGQAGPQAPGTVTRPWGVPGITRLFAPAQVGDISWLLPAALILLVVLLVWRRGAPRRDIRRAALLAWGLWLLCAGLVFSFMAGIFHPYYTVALAPPVAALAGVGTVVCWQQRERLWARATLAATLAAAGATSFLVLRYAPVHYYPWLRWIVLGVAVALALWVIRVGGAAGTGRRPVSTMVIGAVAVVALAGPTAYSLTTVIQGNHGALPVAGPARRIGAMQASRTAHVAGCSLLETGTPDRAVVNLLNARAESFTWVAATVGSVCASGYQLATGHPVMPVGGFNGTDPAPAPDQFDRLVLANRIHYFVVTNPIHEDKWGHLNDSGLIQQWVQRNFTPIRVGKVMLYDLTR